MKTCNVTLDKPTHPQQCLVTGLTKGYHLLDLFLHKKYSELTAGILPFLKDMFKACYGKELELKLVKKK